MSGSNSKRSHAAFFFLFIVFIASHKLSYCMRNNGIVCPKIEKESLLTFKQTLKNPSNKLSSWDGEVDCCKWEGVVCNNFTGHVHQLHLSGQYLSDRLNPSLLNLKHLTYLDLSQNFFLEETIPSFIGSFTKLEYLNLSNAGFQGKIPHSIGNLSNLHTLDLEGSDFVFDLLELHVDSLEWLSGLSRLEILNMNYVNLSRATNWAKVINTLPALLELHFHYCALNFMTPLNDVNMTSLMFLDLSHNNFQSFAIPRWIFQLSNLLYLYLSDSHLVGQIPTISNATKLHNIDLSGNSLNSGIPNWLYFCKDLKFVSLSKNLLHGTISNAIGSLTTLNTLDLSHNQLSGKIAREIANLCKIKKLDLSYNNLQGDISYSFGNMSECFLGSLEGLDLQRNRISGHLTDQFGEFKRLEDISLSNNLLSGAIPISLLKLSSLERLYLDSNNLTGNLPESLGQLFNLIELNIADNKLEGVVTESHFANLTKLDIFHASRNHFTLNVSPNWSPPIQITALGLGSWNLGAGSGIPSWLQTQKNIQLLDLSNTGISGSVPTWFWDTQYLNLSHNNLHGKIPDLYNTEAIIISSNQFSGSLPPILSNVHVLDLSNNSLSGGMSNFLCADTSENYELEILHLGGNQLSGELPDCWMNWPSLEYLNLGNNNMSGSIPNSMGYLANLHSLNLYNNKFSGQIPFSMHNSTELVKIGLAGNDLNGKIPTWMGTTLVKLRILILRSNKLSGEIPSEICHLNYLQILDLSDNKISGTIPWCVYNFTGMATKRSFDETDLYIYTSSSSSVSMENYKESASIATKGREFHYDTILPLVTNIDLSKNNLSGIIPKGLTRLVELRSLNLSENHLIGLIPDNIGDMKELESLDFSRNSLSGHIPNSFKLMSSLNYLNLSYNNLTGRIPESTQLLSFSGSSFTGNNLCGPPSTINCSPDGDKVPEHKEDNEGDKSQIEWFYVFLSLGYAVGFSVVCTILVLKKSWREAYFGFLECMWDRLYVYVYVKWRRLTKPGGPSW